MNPLLIGELAPDQPSFEPSKNVSVIKNLVLGLKLSCLTSLTGKTELPVHEIIGFPGITVG